MKEDRYGDVRLVELLRHFHFFSDSRRPKTPFEMIICGEVSSCRTLVESTTLYRFLKAPWRFSSSNNSKRKIWKTWCLNEIRSWCSFETVTIFILIIRILNVFFRKKGLGILCPQVGIVAWMSRHLFTARVRGKREKFASTRASLSESWDQRSFGDDDGRVPDFPDLPSPTIGIKDMAISRLDTQFTLLSQDPNRSPCHQSGNGNASSVEPSPRSSADPAIPSSLWRRHVAIQCNLTHPNTVQVRFLPESQIMMKEMNYILSSRKPIQPDQSEKTKLYRITFPSEAL